MLLLIYLLFVVRYLFDNNNKTLEPAKLTEVKNFVFAIIEAMNDRTLALAHQRKANKYNKKVLLFNILNLLINL